MQLSKQFYHGHQSDADEGFIASKNTIHERKQIEIRREQKRKQTKKQFISRYILEGIMRKQPEECYQRFTKFDFVEDSPLKSQESLGIFSEGNVQKDSDSDAEENNIRNKTKNSQKQKLLTPFDKFMASGEYYLIYSRYKDFKFTNQESNFANNYVRLDCLKINEEAKYKTIKPFEIMPHKKQQILMPNPNKTENLKETVLQFDSKFECGNLLCAFKHKKQPYTYSLFIQNDTNTYGYNQWFYFSIKNAEVGIKYKFNLINFRKSHSFFKSGNKPVVFSLADSKRKGMSGYSKRGEKIQYQKSSITKSYSSKQKFYKLSFELKFWNQNDLYYISAGLPYSYSKLLSNLNVYEQISKKNNISWSLESIGTSVGGNSIPYVTITKFQDHHAPCKDTLKKMIFVTARQHPGQTWSSYLMDEFILSLISKSTPQSKYLVQNFIIKCIPMINVDGVICGNFRCDLTGMDLNRNWKNPSALFHPQIFSITNEIINLVEQGYQIQTYFDLHGHSKEYNMFCYSCKTDDIESRIMPHILSHFNQQFHFPLCTFGISRYKQTTARAVLFNIIKNPNVLTMELSFYGSKINGKFKMFEPQSFRRMAESMIKSCKSYFTQDERYHKSKQTLKEKINQFLSFKAEKTNNTLSGSDSQPSGDQMTLKEKLQKVIPKSLAKECEQIEEMKKQLKKPKKKIKKISSQLTQGSTAKKKQNLPFPQPIMTIQYCKDETPSKKVKSTMLVINNKKSEPSDNYRTKKSKNGSFIQSNKTIKDEEVEEDSKGLAQEVISRKEYKFFSTQKQNLTPMKLGNQSFEVFQDAYNATEKNIMSRYDGNNQDLNSSIKFRNKRLTSYKESFKRDLNKQQFPLLCVMSQNKKKYHFQMMKIRGQQVMMKSFSKEKHLPYKIKTAIQTRTEAIKQLRQRNKDNVDLVSKIWRENFHKYAMASSTFRPYS